MLKTVVLILKGLVLGMSILIPGVSGGTMAFIMGIYEKLLQEISKLKKTHLKSLLLCFNIKRPQFQKTISLWINTWDWAFLVPLIFGIILAFFIFIVLAFPLIQKYNLEFYSIIFGLVLAPTFTPFKKLNKTVKILSIFILSFIINIFLFSLGNYLSFSVEKIGAWLFLPVGFVISLALIIPGLSGSYLLVLFGLYEKSLLALKNGDLLTIFFFLIGVLMGFVFVAKGIYYLIKNYNHETNAFILGLILGSLYFICPLEKQNIGIENNQTQVFLLYSLLSLSIFLFFQFFYGLYKKKSLK